MLQTPMRVFTVALTGLLAASLTAAQASATGSDAAAGGFLGSVDVVVDGEQVVRAPIAPCEVSGKPSNSSGTVRVGDVALYRGGTSACEVDDDDNAHAAVEGRVFKTDVLREWGGPRIRASSFSASCRTTGNGSSATMEVRGIRGIDVPEEIPPNYTVTIPGRIEGAAPLAKVVVNELIAPSPPDGSMTVNAMRIELFPEGGGPNSGEIVVGAVSCDPYGG